MKKTFRIEEFADIVRMTGSLFYALGTLAQIYKKQMPKTSTIQSNAMSCYLSGACRTLLLMSNLGYLTEEGERLTAEFVTELNNASK